MDRRSSNRMRTQIATICRVPATPENTAIRDISTTGCRLAFKYWVPVKPGTTCHIDLGEGLIVTGKVLRVDPLSCGVEFETPLDEEAASRLGLAERASVSTADSIDDYEYPEQSEGGSHWMRGLRRMQQSIEE